MRAKKVIIQKIKGNFRRSQRVTALKVAIFYFPSPETQIEIQNLNGLRLPCLLCIHYALVRIDYWVVRSAMTVPSHERACVNG